MPLSAAEIRARLVALAAEAMEMLDALDARQADMEPDHDGGAEFDESSTQPVTLAAACFPARTICPSVAQMRVAYRRNGDPIPANLRRGLFGRVSA